METTAGFSSSRRSRNNLPRSSNSSFKWQYRGMNKSWGNFLTCDFEDVSANVATTSYSMAKWRPRLDLACQKGPETPLVAALIVGLQCFFDGRRFGGNF